MHDSSYTHEHELEDEELRSCCLDCHHSLEIIKPHILGFHDRIKHFSRRELEAMGRDDLYGLYQLLDDIAHLDVGPHLASHILSDFSISALLPDVRAYYAAFFDIHERDVAREICASESPRKALDSFVLLPRYEGLIKNQVEGLGLQDCSKVLFLGCGPLPISLILLNSMYGTKSIGIDEDAEAVSIARSCLEKLGLEGEIEILRGNETSIADLDFDLFMIAALAEPKYKIFRTALPICREKGNVPLVYRTYSGMRAVLYEPVKPADTAGFRKENEIAPSGKINNTLVLLKPN